MPSVQAAHLSHCGILEATWKRKGIRKTALHTAEGFGQTLPTTFTFTTFSRFNHTILIVELTVVGHSITSQVSFELICYYPVILYSLTI